MDGRGHSGTEVAVGGERLAANGSAPDPAHSTEPRTREDPAPTGVEPRPLANAAKRSFDLVVAFILLLLGSPLLLAIAIGIKADTPGPILFRQPRMGRNGKEFGMLKFRTMIKGADRRKLELLHMNEAPDGLFKISRDPRITRFGRWLRATSLDELPQLVHVLTGEMSLVGPRPFVPDEDARITEPYRIRLMMRPGMTGPWQVAGASRIPLSEMVELDKRYVLTWTLWGDLKLLVRTVPHVVARRGV